MSGSAARKPSGPPSTTNPSRRSVTITPPARRPASSTTTSAPERRSSRAAARPASPRPPPPPSSYPRPRRRRRVRHFRHRGDEKGVVVQRRGTLEPDPQPLGELPIRDVHVVEHLDMVAHESYGDDENGMTARAGQLGEHDGGVGAEPRFRGGAGALVGEPPRAEPRPPGHGGGAGAQLLRVGVAGREDALGKAVRREDHVHRL